MRVKCWTAYCNCSIIRLPSIPDRGLILEPRRVLMDGSSIELHACKMLDRLLQLLHFQVFSEIPEDQYPWTWAES